MINNRIQMELIAQYLALKHLMLGIQMVVFMCKIEV